MDCDKIEEPKIGDIVIVKLIKIYLDGFSLLQLQNYPIECGQWVGILMITNGAKQMNILNECIKVKLVRVDPIRKYFDAVYHG